MRNQIDLSSRYGLTQSINCLYSIVNQEINKITRLVTKETSQNSFLLLEGYGIARFAKRSRSTMMTTKSTLNKKDEHNRVIAVSCFVRIVSSRLVSFHRQNEKSYSNQTESRRNLLLTCFPKFPILAQIGKIRSIIRPRGAQGQAKQV
jgi:hypothetical protein